MKIKIKTLGPIKEGAEIELADLTVFFGPQNSGKSTTMKAIYYSLFPPEIKTSYEKNEIKIDAIKIKYNFITDKGLEFSVDPNEEYLKVFLPEGEFSAEPSFLSFVKQNSVYEIYEDKLKPSSLTVSNECNKDVIMEILNEGIPFKAEIVGQRGKVSLDIKDSELTPTCKKSLYAEVGKEVLYQVGKRILGLYVEKFREQLSITEGISGAVYVPYPRSLIISELFELLSESTNIFDRFLLGMSIAMSLRDFPESHKRILFSRSFNNEVYKLIKPLIPGDVIQTADKLVYVEEGRQIPWKFVSGSIMELMSLPMLIRPNEIIFYEEPETQLYEKSQVVMALILYSLLNTNKIVVTTHSQTILYTLSYLTITKPSANDVKELLESLGIKGGEELAKAVETANTKTVRFYFFHDGKVEEVNADKMVEGIPDVVDIMHKEFEWLSKLYWRKRVE